MSIYKDISNLKPFYNLHFIWIVIKLVWNCSWFSLSSKLGHLHESINYIKNSSIVANLQVINLLILNINECCVWSNNKLEYKFDYFIKYIIYILLYCGHNVYRLLDCRGHCPTGWNSWCSALNYYQTTVVMQTLNMLLCIVM